MDPAPPSVDWLASAACQGFETCPVAARWGDVSAALPLGSYLLPASTHRPHVDDGAGLSQPWSNEPGLELVITNDHAEANQRDAHRLAFLAALLTTHCRCVTKCQVHLSSHPAQVDQAAVSAASLVMQSRAAFRVLRIRCHEHGLLASLAAAHWRDHRMLPRAQASLEIALPTFGTPNPADARVVAHLVAAAATNVATVPLVLTDCEVPNLRQPLLAGRVQLSARTVRDALLHSGAGPVVPTTAVLQRSARVLITTHWMQWLLEHVDWPELHTVQFADRVSADQAWTYAVRAVRRAPQLRSFYACPLMRPRRPMTDPECPVMDVSSATIVHPWWIEGDGADDDDGGKEEDEPRSEFAPAGNLQWRLDTLCLRLLSEPPAGKDVWELLRPMIEQVRQVSLTEHGGVAYASVSFLLRGPRGVELGVRGTAAAPDARLSSDTLRACASLLSDRSAVDVFCSDDDCKREREDAADGRLEPGLTECYLRAAQMWVTGVPALAQHAAAAARNPHLWSLRIEEALPAAEWLELASRASMHEFVFAPSCLAHCLALKQNPCAFHRVVCGRLASGSACTVTECEAMGAEPAKAMAMYRAATAVVCALYTGTPVPERVCGPNGETVREMMVAFNNYPAFWAAIAAYMGHVHESEARRAAMVAIAAGSRPADG